MANMKSKNVLLTIMGILILGMIVVTILTFQYNIMTGISRLISLLFVTLYGFFMYKIPHNNLLKFAMLLSVVTDVINASVYLSDGKSFATNLIRLFAAAGIVYCAGRLDRIKQNKIILLVIDAVTLIMAAVNTIIYSTSVGFLMTLRIFGTFVLYTTIIIAYLVRFDEHREAGIFEKLNQ